jgi:hypothetical protein
MWVAIEMVFGPDRRPYFSASEMDMQIQALRAVAKNNTLLQDALSVMEGVQFTIGKGKVFTYDPYVKITELHKKGLI